MIAFLFILSESKEVGDSTEKKAKAEVSSSEEEVTSNNGQSRPEVDFATIKIGGVLPGLGSYNDNSSDSDSESCDIDSDDCKQVQTAVSLRTPKKCRN